MRSLQYICNMKASKVGIGSPADKTVEFIAAFCRILQNIVKSAENFWKRGVKKAEIERKAFARNLHVVLKIKEIICCYSTDYLLVFVPQLGIEPKSKV